MDTLLATYLLHSQLIDAVNRHEYVLKGSLSLIRQLESMPLLPDQHLFLTSADVAALYPSIDIDDGIKALQWLMATHTSIPQNLQPKYLELARFVLENTYVECKGIEGAFLQKIGTAMGTSFSVTYAVIFMIWLETIIIHEFCKYIVLCKRYIDDILLIWSGPSSELCKFRAKFGNANSNIKLEWQGTSSAMDAEDPAKFNPHQHSRVNFFDLDIRILDLHGSPEFDFRIYRKAGNAYSYLPCGSDHARHVLVCVYQYTHTVHTHHGSYHARHVFRGCLKAEVQRLHTHSSNPSVWLEECRESYQRNLEQHQLEPASKDTGVEGACRRKHRCFLC
jgi:hypothetical protein